MQTTAISQNNKIHKITYPKGRPVEQVTTEDRSEGKFSTFSGTQITLEYSLTNDKILIKKVILDESEKKALPLHLFRSGVAKALLVYAKENNFRVSCNASKVMSALMEESNYAAELFSVSLEFLGVRIGTWLNRDA